jgi:hypothetical protein
MSPRRRLRPTNPASMLIRAHDGSHIPGGCDHCNAYQVVHADYWGETSTGSPSTTTTGAHGSPHGRRSSDDV